MHGYCTLLACHTATIRRAYGFTMSRRRYISTTISMDKGVNALAQAGGDFAALLYTWMIPHAEDTARMTGDPEELLYMVIPGRRDKSTSDVVDALNHMVSLGLISWDDGVIYFDSASFYRYQAYIPASKRSDNGKHFAKIGEKRRLSPKVAQNGASLSPSLSPSPSLTEIKSVLSDSGESAGAINAAFDEWWTAYGKVGSKAEALSLYRWWRTTGKASADDLLAAAVNYRAHCSATDCKMQHGRTFLAKKPNRWDEWARGEEHGGMDAGATTHLIDVLAAGAKAFGLTGDDNGNGHRSHELDSRTPTGNPPSGGGLPAGELACG